MNPIDRSLRMLFREVIAEEGAHGIDMAPESFEPFTVEVLCDTGEHSIPDGTECPHCGANPKCAGCPGKDE